MSEKPNVTRCIFARRRICPAVALVMLLTMGSGVIYVGNAVSPIDGGEFSFHPLSLMWHMAVCLITAILLGPVIWGIFQDYHTRISASGIEQPHFLRAPLSFGWEEIDRLSTAPGCLYLHAHGQRILVTLAFFRHPEQVVDTILECLDAAHSGT